MYRHEHRHSGIQFITPADRHAGKSNEILEARRQVYEAAKARHPERWQGRNIRNLENVTAVYLNPDKSYTETAVDTSEKDEAVAL